MVRAGAVKHPKDWEFCGYNQGKFGKQYKIKSLPAPAFEVKQYGQIRVKNDTSSRENNPLQDYMIFSVIVDSF